MMFVMIIYISIITNSFVILNTSVREFDGIRSGSLCTENYYMRYTLYNRWI